MWAFDGQGGNWLICLYLHLKLTCTVMGVEKKSSDL